MLPGIVLASGVVISASWQALCSACWDGSGAEGVTRSIIDDQHLDSLELRTAA
ncbi:MAG TPA: hypothetical protein VGQ23_02085 [Burkholderiaceae bacterium]|jgi:hypothetical protein|nr:hypothetical protein [Burkholderiaceae bacterium]